MSNYSTLKGHIDNAIYQNDTQDISGTDMNSILKEIVDSFGAGYLYMGVATPSTDPRTPDQNVFYIAGTEGTYTNFGGITVANEVAVLKYNGAWSKQDTGIKFVSVSQNTPTGTNHTRISVGENNYDVASAEDINAIEVDTGVVNASKDLTNTSVDFVIIDQDLNLGRKFTIKVTSLTATFDIAYFTVMLTDGNGHSAYEGLQTNGTLLNISNSFDVTHIKIYIGASHITGTGNAALQITKTANIPNRLSALETKTSELDKEKTGYYTCNTAGNIAEKTVVASKFALAANIRIVLRLDNVNTADNVTLNINSTGEKPLYFNGIQMSSSNKPAESYSYLDVFYTGSVYYATICVKVIDALNSTEKNALLSANMGRILNSTARYAGVANKTTNPGTPTSRVFYIATESGAYQYFSNLEVTNYSALVYRPNTNDWGLHDWGIPFESSANFDEFLPKLTNLRLSYKAYGNEDNTPCLTLLHFSDLHNADNSLAKIKKYADDYSLYIDDVIQTGDINDYNESIPSSLSSMNALGVIGNHEASYVQDGERVWVTAKQDYDKYISPFISNWGVTQPTGAAENGYNYYYKDYASKNVRIVVLDGEHQDATQYSWFETVLADARTNNLHVVCAIHRPPFAIEHNNANPFCSVDYNSGNDGVEFASRVANYISAGGIFVCWLTGHIHDDVMGTNSNYPGQLMISIACASYYPSVQFSSMKRSLGDYTRDCFNFIGIDTISKTIKIMRVGANFDRYMRKKTALSWDYNTNQLIYCY